MFFIADCQQPSPDGGIEQMLLMVGIAILFFYIIMWRPEQKRKKEMDNKRNSLKKGDQIILSGGILGEISKIETETVVVRLHDGAKMEVLKGAVQDIREKKQS